MAFCSSQNEGGSLVGYATASPLGRLFKVQLREAWISEPGVSRGTRKRGPADPSVRQLLD